MRKWKICELAYSEYFEKMIPTEVLDVYGHDWKWSEEDLVYWNEAEIFMYFDTMILRLDEAGLIVKEAPNDFAY